MQTYTASYSVRSFKGKVEVGCVRRVKNVFLGLFNKLRLT